MMINILVKVTSTVNFLQFSLEFVPRVENTQHAMPSFAAKMITACIAHKMTDGDGASSRSRYNFTNSWLHR